MNYPRVAREGNAERPVRLAPLPHLTPAPAPVTSPFKTVESPSVEQKEKFTESEKRQRQGFAEIFTGDVFSDDETETLR